MTHTARKIRYVFATSSFHFGPPTCSLFHIIVVEGKYMLCSIEEFFFFQVEQSCSTMV